MCKPLFCALLAIGLIYQSAQSQDSTAIYFSKKISADSIKTTLRALASDSLEGRETGRPGQKKAAALIESRLRDFGLKPGNKNSFAQAFYLNARTNTGKNLLIHEKRFVFRRDFFYPSGQSDTTLVIDTIIVVGHGIKKATRKPAIDSGSRKTAMLFIEKQPMARKKLRGPEDWSLSGKLKFASEEGAAAAFILTDSIEQAIGRADELHLARQSAKVPFAFITRKAAAAFFQENSKRRLEHVERKVMNGATGILVSGTETQFPIVKNTDQLIGENVLGLLEGTDKKDEVLILTAHYDHLGIRDSMIYYGADDNGSGTSAVLEIARVFSEAAKAGQRPRRSILFMTVSGEEKGLLGSNYFVKRPPIPLNEIIANLNTDMIGRTDPKHDSLQDPNYVYVIGSDKLSTTLHQINEAANQKTVKLQLDYTFNKPDDPNRYYYRSDHYNFAKHNIPVIFYFSGSHADYHKPSDTSEKIQYDLLTRRAQLIFLTAWELANREERIKVDVVSDMPEKPGDEK